MSTPQHLSTPGWIGPNHRTGWAVRAGTVSTVPPPREPVPVTMEAAPARLEVDLARTALVVVDMQNDFCHPDGWLASIGVDVSGGRDAVAAVAELVPALRARDVPIVWLNWGTRPDRANLPPGVLHVYDPDGTDVGIGSPARTGHPVLEQGSWGAALVDGLTPTDDDLQVAKHRMSGFWDTELDTVLRMLGVQTLLFAGVNTDQCVYATLVDASCIGYDSVLIEDCCATTSPPYCADATLYNVRQCFGFTTTTDALHRSLSEDV